MIHTALTQVFAKGKPKQCVSKTHSDPSRLLYNEISPYGQTGEEEIKHKTTKSIASKTVSSPPRLTVQTEEALSNEELPTDGLNKAGVHLQHVYFESECFEHFHYISQLVKDCRSRVDKVRKTPDDETMWDCEVMIRLSYVGKLDVAFPIQKSIQGGKSVASVNRKIWEAAPLLCFQNDLSHQTALELLKGNDACHKFFVKSREVSRDWSAKEKDIEIIDYEHVLEAITSCLEDPLHRMLDKWIKQIRETGSTRETVWMILEMENIQKQMTFKKPEQNADSLSATLGFAENVPRDVKEYLARRADVNAFGTWINSHFKVFTTDKADNQKLHDELTKIDATFFKKYILDIESRKFVKNLSLRQGSHISPEKPNKDGYFVAGTLGGFITQTEEPEKKYALTCNHIFPITDIPAYAEISQKFEEIGKCVYTTRENHCDFAAIEISETASKECNITFRREDKKETNALVYDDNLENLAILHKIGAESDVTTGFILSDEFYINPLIDEDNRDFVFLVRGVNGLFSKSGDSGSLVFSRPREVSHNSVYVVGMVFGFDTNLTVYENSKEEDAKSQETDTSVKLENGANNCSGTPDGKDLPASCSRIKSEHISMCYLIRPALDLFVKNQGFSVNSVKFKDDLPSSSPFLS
uniref:Uncharacterized protein LOC111111056 isoform X2 n=1 Tax=Crassostrea virginica TaxID=6565 RepID=A0A8B8BKZ0_CRAVI|nr:uncharacterized protein LOC111111056 isoform X2 [Crassostrea virginica]XP_022303509.1 uncharacterized protein LOC111111056 isoform X2 [Crassostrea virginica]